MPSHRYPTPHRRQPKPDRRRALELLAQCPHEGCSETLLLAHGFTRHQLVDLVRAGLVTATSDCVVTGTHEFEVATLRITEAGRKVLAEAKPGGAS